jgi:DNA-binding response OmpR family regulator
MNDLLEMRGWDTVICREADSAYPVLKQERPSLIILDVRMDTPERGWNILELLTLDPETRDIPVIVCSAALDDLRDKEHWLAEHGIAILPKPFDIDDLYARVETGLAKTAQEI